MELSLAGLRGAPGDESADPMRQRAGERDGLLERIDFDRGGAGPDHEVGHHVRRARQQQPDLPCRCDDIVRRPSGEGGQGPSLG
jgi:hypothetical protein